MTFDETRELVCIRALHGLLARINDLPPSTEVAEAWNRMDDAICALDRARAAGPVIMNRSQKSA
jgi:hypothetical protein